MIRENTEAGQALNILPMITEKHLKSLIYVLEHKRFYPSPVDEIGEDENFVGKMISFEKAIYSRIRDIDSKISDIEKIINRQKIKDSIRAKRNNKKCETLVELFVAHRCLLGQRISNRLGSCLSLAGGYSAIGFGIRKGYKIVAISCTEKNTCKMYEQTHARMCGERSGEMNFY